MSGHIDSARIAIKIRQLKWYWWLRFSFIIKRIYATVTIVPLCN